MSRESFSFLFLPTNVSATLELLVDIWLEGDTETGLFFPSLRNMLMRVVVLSPLRVEGHLFFPRRDYRRPYPFLSPKLHLRFPFPFSACLRGRNGKFFPFLLSTAGAKFERMRISGVPLFPLFPDTTALEERMDLVFLLSPFIFPSRFCQLVR